MNKTSIINVQGFDIAITKHNQDDYICLTDMIKAKDGESRAADIIKNWIRNRGTIEFLGTWESFYNPNFKVVEFDHFRKESGLPTFTMSVNNWVEKTNAIEYSLNKVVMVSETAKDQRELLSHYDYMKSIKKIDNNTFID